MLNILLIGIIVLLLCALVVLFGILREIEKGVRDLRDISIYIRSIEMTIAFNQMKENICQTKTK